MYSLRKINARSKCQALLDMADKGKQRFSNARMSLITNMVSVRTSSGLELLYLEFPDAHATNVFRWKTTGNWEFLIALDIFSNIPSSLKTAERKRLRHSRPYCLRISQMCCSWSSQTLRFGGVLIWVRYCTNVIPDAIAPIVLHWLAKSGIHNKGCAHHAEAVSGPCDLWGVEMNGW